MKSVQLTLKVTKSDDDFLEGLVERGDYFTKCEVIRAAIKGLRDKESGKKGEGRHENS